MARPSSLNVARIAIISLFAEAQQKIYSQAMLAQILRANRSKWKLAASIRLADFIALLEKHELKQQILSAEPYDRKIVRYSWGKVTPYELALSITERAYLSHATAAALHGLIKLPRNEIYLNLEQSPKPAGGGSLTQESIDRAFAAKQRRSNLVYKNGRTSVTIIAGKNTNRLGVERLICQFENIWATNLERTLVDMVVRPAYAGGPSQLIKAYRGARDKVSVNKLVAVLKQLQYVYPYHQPIGFLMERAGYSEDHLTQLRALGLDFDFYLTHGMQETNYSETWRLFYPQGLR